MNSRTRNGLSTRIRKLEGRSFGCLFTSVDLCLRHFFTLLCVNKQAWKLWIRAWEWWIPVPQRWSDAAMQSGAGGVWGIEGFGGALGDEWGLHRCSLCDGSSSCLCDHGCQFSAVAESRPTLCNPMDLQHARPPCPSPTPGACLNSCASSQWCHPGISSSVIPFSSCLQSFPASGTWVSFLHQLAKVLELQLQLQHQSFQWIFRADFL